MTTARFSTAPLDDAQRSSQWEAWNRRALVGLRCRTPDGRGLRGDEVNLTLPALSLARVRAERHEAVRDAALIEQVPSDAVVVYAVLRGRTSFRSAVGAGRLAAGEATVVDGDLPFDRCFPEPFAELVLRFPRALYADRFGAGARPPGRPASLSALAGVRAAALARHLAGPVAALGSSAEPALERESGTDLQTVALDLLTDLIDRGRPGDRSALARLLVHQHLGDPTFAASRLAGLLGVSSRQLTRLFAECDTSFPAYLTERRLALASTLLRERSGRPIGEVASSCGFASASYFTRVFARQYGLTPREFRER